jgi:hypothetical protein
VVEEWEEEEWIPRTCSHSCLAVAVDSLAEVVAVRSIPCPSVSADAQALDHRDHERARTSYTESLSRSRISTRAKSKSSPYQNPSFVNHVKVEVVKRDLSLLVHHVEDKVSKSCYVNSDPWSNKSNNHVTNVRELEK